MTDRAEVVRLKRTKARERLRAGFLEQALGSVDEVLALLSEAERIEVARDAAAHTLERVANTARAVDAPEVHAAAVLAAAAVGSGADATETLAELRRILRDEGAGTRFPPIGIVADSKALVELQTEAQTCCEPILVVGTVEELESQIRYDVVQGVFLPPEAVARPPAGVLVFTYGKSSDGRARLAAAQAGAGFVPTPLRLCSMLHSLRVAASEHIASRRVVLMTADDARSEALTAVLEGNGIVLERAEDPDRLVYLLANFRPDLLVLGPRPDVAELLQLLQAGRDVRGVPAIVVAQTAEVSDLVEAGALDVLDPSVSVRALEARVLARLTELRYQATEVDRGSDTLSRSAVLAALDDEIARARRTRHPVAVAVIEVHGLGVVEARWGGIASDRVLRALTGLFVRNLRGNDRLGRVGPATFLAVMPHCRGADAARRIEEVRQAWRGVGSKKERARPVGFSVGVADTGGGWNRVLQQADRHLARALAQGDRSTVGG